MTNLRELSCALAVLFASSLGASLVDEYNFNGDLTSTTAGPALTNIGVGNTFSTEVVDGVSTGILEFTVESGVHWPAPTSLESYSISALFRFETVVGWRKVMDFDGRASDCGFYVRDGGAEYFCFTEAGGSVRAHTWHELTITRDAASNRVKLWVDGVEAVSFIDGGDILVDAAKGVSFFVDDFETGGDITPGAVARLRIYDAPIVPDIRTPEKPVIPCPVPLTTTIPTSERTALLDLYEATNGDTEWADNTHWGCEAGTECSWAGVGCDEVGEHVVNLTRSGNLMSGPIPPSIADLTRLDFLDLGGNRLTGSIPSEIGQLADLEILTLSRNQL